MNMKPHLRLVCAWLLPSLFSAQAIPAQQAPAPPPTIRVTTRLVVLDVRVVDADGNFVSGLDRSQFKVYEDKTEQRIRDFEPPASHAMPKASGPLVRSTADMFRIGNAPVNVLVIDELNTPFTQSAFAQQALKRFLQKQPEVLPVPTLFLASGASRVTVLHDFTQSRDDLLQSMTKHVTDVDFQALSAQLNGGTMSAQDGFAKTLGALSQVASSLHGIPGHKNVIWVGTGFDKAYDLTSASSLDEQNIEDALLLVTRRLLDARVSISTIDPAGVNNEPIEDVESEILAGAGPSPALDFSQDASFDELARSTGGTVVHGRNDLDRLVAEDAGAAGDFYTLTYSPSNLSDTAKEYRHIRVTTTNPALHVITRTGYFNGAAEAPVTPQNPKTLTREFKFDLRSASQSRLVYTGLHVAARPVPEGYQLLIKAEDLQFNTQGDGSRIAELSVVGMAFDRKDKTIAQHAMEMKEQIKSTDVVAGNRLGFDFRFAVPANATRVRLVVRDAATGNIGSVELTH